MDAASGLAGDAKITPKAIFAGLATLDVVQLVDRLPRSNEKLVAREFLLAAGGPAANAAVAFAACGGSPVLVTALPEHPLTAVIVEDLERHGVGVVVAAHYEGAPVTASILVEAATGDRAVVSPSSVATVEVAATAALPAVDGAGAVLIDGYFRSLSLPLAAAARKRGVPVIMDGGSVKPHTPEVLALADVAVVSGDFAPAGTEGAPDAVLDWLAGNGAAFAAVTRGAEPIPYRTPAGGGEVAITAVDVRDTLGAGDFFHGALAARLAAQGLDEARFAADLEWASAVAGRSLGSFGTRAWLA